MEYIAKYKVSKNKYLAVLDKAMVIVTTDENGKPIRYAIFEKHNKETERKENKR